MQSSNTKLGSQCSYFSSRVESSHPSPLYFVWKHGRGGMNYPEDNSSLIVPGCLKRRRGVGTGQLGLMGAPGIDRWSPDVEALPCCPTGPRLGGR